MKLRMPPRDRAPLAALAIGLALAAPAAAQVPQITINRSHGSSFLLSDLNADDELPLAGVAGVDYALIGVDYQILVQGRVPNSVSPGPPGTTLFLDDVSVGPQPPTWNAGVWPSWYPNLNVFRYERHVLKPILVELVDFNTAEVVDRARIVIFDLREGPLNPHFGGGPLDAAMGVQLTPEGLSELDAPHRSTLPRPDLAALDDALADLIGPGIEGEQPVEPDVCFELTADWKQLDAYKAARDRARVAYATYKGTKAFANGVASAGPLGALLAAALQASAQGMCVKTPVKRKNFQACVRRLDGLLTSATVGGVGKVDLSFGPNDGQVDADVRLDGIHASVDGYARDVEIRYKPDKEVCLDRPSAVIDESEYASIDWLAEWSSCPALAFDADRAVTDPPVKLSLAAEASDAERLHVEREAPGVFGLVLPEVEAASGLCADPDLVTAAEDLLWSYEASVASLVSDGWDFGSPAMHEAAAFDVLLDGFGFELGTYEPADYALTAELTEVSTVQPEGLRLHWSTEAKAAVYAPGQNPTDFPFTPNDDLPWSPTGTSPNAEPFDLAFTISTGHMSQILRELSGTTRVAFSASWQDLGLTPPVGSAPEDPALLDGTALAAWHSALGDLGAHQVEIRLAPTLRPFVWMPPDTLPPELPGELPLIFNLRQYELTLVEETITSDVVWLRAYIDLYDDLYSVEIDDEPGSRLLATGFGNPFWTFMIVDEELPSCPKEPHAVSSNPMACERLLEGALWANLEPFVAPAIESLLSELPAPQVFDAAGEASSKRQLVALEPWNEGQNVILFGDLQ
jgi:hypothetical protein